MTETDTAKLKKFLEMVDEASEIAIVTHMHPDGDAIGSATGLFHYLESVGKSAVIVLNDRCPDSLAFLTEGAESHIRVYENGKDETETAICGSDLIFCLDMGAFDRAENLKDALQKAGCRKILIDHHLNPDLRRSDETTRTHRKGPAGTNDHRHEQCRERGLSVHLQDGVRTARCRNGQKCGIGRTVSLLQGKQVPAYGEIAL